MNKAFSNPCSRCGTERVVLKTWKEHIGNSVVINIEKICPNADCQKVVSSDNKKQSDRYAAMKLKSEQRAFNRKTIKVIGQVKKGKKINKR